MYKKSLVRIEKENQSDLNNAALNDIIASNDVDLSKDSNEKRLSSACKAATFMIVFVLATIGILIPTVWLATFTNASMNITSPRGVQPNSSLASNDSRTLRSDQENLTTITNELKENEYLTQESVSLATANLHMLTTEDVHVSTSIMKITQNENMFSKTETTKTDVLSTTIVNLESTASTIIQTTMSDRETTITPSTINNRHLYTSEMTTQYEPTTVKESQEHHETYSYYPTMTIVDTNSTINENTTMSIFEDSTLVNVIKNSSDLQSSTMIDQNEQTTQDWFHETDSNSTDTDSKDNALFPS